LKLLTAAHQNSKLAKNQQFSQYLSAVLHLAPFTLSGFNVCPAASKGCAMACLNTAGRGRFDNVQQARIRKTKMFFGHRQEFLAQLVRDIHALSRKAFKLGKKPVVRLNGTSDIDWENVYLDNNNSVTIFDMFSNVQFYDYSKRAARFDKAKLPKNYYLIFSRSEVNETIAKRILLKGFNVAMVFASIPNKYKGIEVINGDTHDLRFLEGYKGKIVGLKAKGKAKKDESGFVIHAESLQQMQNIKTA